MKTKGIMAVLAMAIVGVACATSVASAVTPSALFSDHAVLLKSPSTPVFGFAAPGEKVAVSVAGVESSAVAGADGKWIVRLDLSSAGRGPHVMRIGDKTFGDVVVGEVWLASGQSNMSFKMHEADDADVECEIENPGVRCFVVTDGIAERPKDRISGQWWLSGRGRTRGMTAVGYHFAKNLNRALGCPVGIVEAAVGASSIESWCDPETMADDAAGKAAFDKQMAFTDLYREYEKECESELLKWQVRFGRADRAHGMPPETAWKAMTEKASEDFYRGPGAVWLKRTVPAPPSGGDVVLMRRRFMEKGWRLDTSTVEVYWNGKRLERSFPEFKFEKNTELYAAPKDDIRPQNTLMVRFFNSERLFNLPYTLWLKGGKRLPYGGWSQFEEFSLPPATAEARAAMPPRQKFCLGQHCPVGLYNGKIAGLVPMGLSGVIWYQGESNAARAEEYEVLFPAFIKSWRRIFGKSELPFGWCQLAGWKHKVRDPNVIYPSGTDWDWPRLRMAQDRALRLPMTGQAVLIDAGEAADIHPRDKRTPGARLAAWALATVYGKTDVPYLGPRVAKAEPKGGTMAVTFTDCGGGLEARALADNYPERTKEGKVAPLVRNSPNAQVEGFSLAGADGKWHWADEATISGDKVIVSAKAVPNPVKVRYAYAINPVANLYNKEGFPAVPFGD